MGRAPPDIIVIAGLDPALHRSKCIFILMDARVKPAYHDLEIGGAS
jgi:hypothetical protein